jgi:hypothetical protein
VFHAILSDLRIVHKEFAVTIIDRVDDNKFLRTVTSFDEAIFHISGEII